MKQNLESEVRALWQQSCPTMSTDQLDIYFDEIFDAGACAPVYADGRLVACGQWQEHKMTFVGRPISVGVITGLVVNSSLKPAERALHLQHVLRQLHRRQYERGIMYSIIFPADAKQRQYLEKQGYVTASHKLTVETHLPEGYASESRIEVTEAVEWGRELWVFYTQHGGLHDFELKLSEGDFFAMIACHDLNGGSILVARRHNKIVGIALVQREGKPLKNGKASGKQFRMNVKYVLATDEQVLYAMQHKALTLAPDCKQLVMTGGCPAKGFKGATPQTLMRAIDAERFLKFVAEQLPGLQLVVGVSSDEDIPENNKGYRLRDGRCFTSTDLGDSIVTPGGIPAMLFSGQPVQIPEV